MRGKLAKKIRQLYRRDHRTRIALEQGFLSKALRPRSKWLPRWLWILGSRLYFTELPGPKKLVV